MMPRRSFFLPSALALLAFLTASAQGPVVTRPPAVQAHPCDTCLPGVINFAEIDKALWRGAQPTAEGFQALEKAGAR